MLTIKVLGSGCANCKKVEAVARQALEAKGLQAELTKVTDINKIMEYNILATPGLVINQKVVCSGRIPGPEEVAAWLADAAEDSA
ncbi:MAG: TM0996/MTH895 family glutaredoxin-like protein [Anaerolineales bacterium]|nr:TM0996/MTH895 family glutaredoxin-like protein [Anaerolineales bacterium]